MWSFPALDFTTDFCCDRHNGFHLQSLLPGPLFKDIDSDIIMDDATTQEPPQPPTRPAKQRKELMVLLRKWLKTAAKMDPLSRPLFYILSESQIKLITTLIAGTLNSIQSITSHLKQNDDWEGAWADQILGIIMNFDREILEQERQKETEKSQKAQRRNALDQNQDPRPDHPNRTRKPPAWRVDNMDQTETYRQDPTVLGDYSNRTKRRRVGRK